MRNRALSTREILLLLFLVVLLVGVGYYLFFYQPLQAELADLANQSSELDGEIQVAAAKAASMDSMQAVTASDLKDGKTYLSVMEKNLEALKEALN